MKPIRYRVLLAEQLSAADKLTVAAKVSTMYSGPEAKSNSYQKAPDHSLVNDNWQFEVLDRLGRVVTIKYRGAEVATFIKRQVTEVELLPGDPIPEGVIKDPLDVWVRVDLLGVSARQIGSRVGKQKKSIEEELRLSQRHVEIQAALLQGLETDIFNLKKDFEKKDAQIAKLKAAAKAKPSLGEREKSSAPDNFALPKPVPVPVAKGGR